MSVQEWAGLTLTLLSIIGIVLSGIRLYINAQTAPVKEEIALIRDAINDVRKETKTNGGSSMRDEIKSIKAEQERSAQSRAEYNQKLDHMYDILLTYISKNSK